MKRTLLLLWATTALVATAVAQSTPAPSSGAPQGAAPAQNSAAQAQNPDQMPAGTVIPAELSKSIDAKKVKVGDKVEAKTAIDLLSHGKVAIPKNTKIIGHVTEAKAHSKESPDSMVGIVFDRISMKDGHDLQMQAGIQAIGRPLRSAASMENSPMSESGGMASASGPMQSGPMGGRSPAPTSYPPAAGSPTTDPSSPGNGTSAPLAPTSEGVVGMKGLSLKTAGQASVVSSEKDNVHLDSGTQLILRTQ
jgi:hypothetical protein